MARDPGPPSAVERRLQYVARCISSGRRNRIKIGPVVESNRGRRAYATAAEEDLCSIGRPLRLHAKGGQLPLGTADRGHDEQPTSVAFGSKDDAPAVR